MAREPKWKKDVRARVKEMTVHDLYVDAICASTCPYVEGAEGRRYWDECVGGELGSRLSAAGLFDDQKEKQSA